MSWLPSPEYADWWYDLSWKGIIGFGTVAAIATAGTVVFTMLQFWSDSVRDEKSERRNKAMEVQLSEANARALEAQLALEKYKAPRKIDGPAFVAALEGKPKAPVEIVFVRDNPECWQLAMQIRDWLKTANWEHTQPAAISGADEPRFDSYPSAMQAGGQPSGVVIVQRATSQADFERERWKSFDGPLDTPGKALAHALMLSLGTIGNSMGYETGTIGKLRVVVGPKP